MAWIGSSQVWRSGSEQTEMTKYWVTVWQECAQHWRSSLSGAMSETQPRFDAECMDYSQNVIYYSGHSPFDWQGYLSAFEMEKVVKG